MNVDASEIISLLNPLTQNPNVPGSLIFNILLYIIFFLALFVMLRMPDKNILPTLLIATVLLSCVIAKLSITARRDPVFEPSSFGMYIVNLSPLVLPVLVAGTVRARKVAAVVVPSLVMAVFGVFYFFMFWFFVQRGV